MLDYINLIIFIFVLFYLKDIFYKPIYNRLCEKDTWRTDVLKAIKVDFKGKELYYCICSQKIIHSYVENITICFKSTSDDFFEIRKQTMLEKIFIKLLFLKPFQTDNTLYDKSIYTASDNKQLHTQLSKKSLQNNIIDFFYIESPFNYKELKLYNKSDEFCMDISFKIHFSFDKKFKKKDINIDEILDIYGDKFIKISEDIDMTKEDSQNSYEKIKQKVLHIKYLIIFSSVVSFLTLIYNSRQVYPQIIDNLFLTFIGIIASSIFAIIIFLYILFRLKNSSFKIYIALKYALVSILSTSIISIFTIAQLNRTLDSSEEKIVYRKIVSKKRHFKNPGYYIQFDYKYSQSLTDNELEVPFNLYESLNINDTVKVTIKDGNYGVKYIDNIKYEF